MKLLTWNCAGAFRNKTERITQFHPDLVVIQECEPLDKLIFPNGFQPNCRAWFGDPGAAKGVGVFGFSNLHFELADDIYDPSIRYCIPLRVTGSWNYHLVAVWAMAQKDHSSWGYVGQVCRALEKYQEFIGECDTFLLGDFNSNKIFDRPRREFNHTLMVEQLARHEIISLYHEYFHETHGEENHPTFYLTKKVTRPFHLDYCFAPVGWSQQVKQLTVGEFREWRAWSDHCPIFVEF
jgi:exonuclease III